MDYYEIGLMYDNTDPENPVAIDGWHVNSMQPIPGADEFMVHPENPKVGVLGHPMDAVYRYVFENKKQLEVILNIDKVI